MPSIADTATRVAAAGVPVLFLDTCSILDVIRAPIPERKLGGCVEAASELVATVTAATPPALSWSARSSPASGVLTPRLCSTS